MLPSGTWLRPCIVPCIDGVIRQVAASLDRVILAGKAVPGPAQGPLGQGEASLCPWLSIILPAYNEADSLAEAVQAHLDVIERARLPEPEIVLVDDGSQDDTPAVARALAAADARVRLLRLEQNAGQATAILAGFAAARGRWLMHNGVDLPLAPVDLANLARLLMAADDAGPTSPALLVVERQDRTAYGWQRKLLSWANMALVRLLFNSPVWDHNFVQFYRRDLLTTIQPVSRGVSTVTLELILRAYQQNYRVLAVQAPYRPRRAGKSRLKWRAAWHACWETLRLRWLLWRQGCEKSTCVARQERNHRVG